MKAIFCIVLFIPFLASGQTLKGTVTDQMGAVPFASIIIRKENVVKKFTTSDAKGDFEIKLEQPTDSLLLEISTLQHEVFVKKISDILSSKNKNKDVFFLEQRITPLKEVVVRQKPPITIRKDTVEYNPSSFKDGSEKVV